ncbi:MAG TPA: protein YgfX [Burkholderiales bacterium]
MSPGRSLRFSASPALAAAILAAHACAAAAAALTLPGPAGWALAVALAALGGAATWGHALLRSPRSARGLRIEGERAALELANGESVAAQPGGHVNRFLVTLALGAASRRVLIAADMLDAESFRALRVWALWRRLPGVAAKQLIA